MIGLSKRIALALTLSCLFAGVSRASTLTLLAGQLSASNFYYTDLIGGGIGSPLVMTGGGADANVGFSPNDDGFSGPIPLGFVFSFFGENYTEFWANNNGNVSFTAGLAAFIAGETSLGVGVPMIAPFFADVDTLGAGSGLMHLRNDIPNQIIVTWDQVGYYVEHTDKLNSFQLVLRGPDYVIPAGEGQVGFFYKSMQWETGDASGGIGGFNALPGAISAAVGFGDGAGFTEILVERSLLGGIAAIVSDHHIWFNRDVSPSLFAAPGELPIPEPATLLLVGTGAAVLGRKRHSRRRQR